MIIGSITDGIVIDHIPAGRGMELYHYLQLEQLECQVAVIKNAPSTKIGKKDIIKIGELIDLNLTDREKGIYRCRYCDTKAK